MWFTDLHGAVREVRYRPIKVGYRLPLVLDGVLRLEVTFGTIAVFGCCGYEEEVIQNHRDEDVVFSTIVFRERRWFLLELLIPTWD